MGGWTEQQFAELCKKAGVRPEDALKEGKLELDPLHGAKVIAGKKKKAALRKRGQKSYETRVERGVPLSQPKPDSTYALVKAARRNSASDEGTDTRVRVSITGYRLQCIDPDNFTGGLKNLIDCLQLSGLIPEDSWNAIRLETKQIKVPGYGHERTTVEIEFPDI